MNISVFGLGYVGAVSASCLAGEGHKVIGVDPNDTKLNLINSGKPPIIERDIEKLMGDAVKAGLLQATTDVDFAIENSAISFVCVGTPSNANGSLDLSYVRKVCDEIGRSLRKKSDYHIVVIRSTILPGSMRNVVIPVLEEASGRVAGQDFGVCNNPEFLREGTAVYDYLNPPKTVIGEIDERCGDILEQLYADLDAPLIRTSMEVGEMVKYTDNVWHALKVAFGNEVGSICKGLEIDSHAVMDIFCQDTKLNLSPYYLTPGFAFGGSCLPKDVRALRYKSRSLDVEAPVLNAILRSNQSHVDRAVSRIIGWGKRDVGILGLSFKAGTDDLRESPLVDLVERLIGKGYNLRVYDKNVNLARLTGANKEFILNHIPHIAAVMSEDIEEVIAHGNVLVIGNSDAEYSAALSKELTNKKVYDLVRLAGIEHSNFDYEGVCW